MKGLLRTISFAPLHPAVLRRILRLARPAGAALNQQSSQAGDTPQRILVINLSTYLGDGVMMMPFLEGVHRIFPDSLINVVTGSATSQLLRGVPWLRVLSALPAEKSRLPILRTYLRVFQIWWLAKQMRREHAFDLALLPRWGRDPNLSAWLALFLGTKQVYGHDPEDDTYGGAVPSGVQQILSRSSRGGTELPEAMRELRLLESTGLASALRYDEEAMKPSEILQSLRTSVPFSSLVRRAGLTAGEAYVVMAPGASSPSRRWPATHYADLAGRLYQHAGLRTLVLGGPDETKIGREMKQVAGVSVIDLAGQTTLPESVALLGAASLVVTNDSGPAHLAAGAGAPTLVLSSCPSTSTREHAGSPNRVRPVGPDVIVLQPQAASLECVEQCNADVAHCILQLSVSEVQQRALEILNRDIGSG